MKQAITKGNKKKVWLHSSLWMLLGSLHPLASSSFFSRHTPHPHQSRLLTKVMRLHGFLLISSRSVLLRHLVLSLSSYLPPFHLICVCVCVRLRDGWGGVDGGCGLLLATLFSFFVQ